jgi:hypothetical protein
MAAGLVVSACLGALASRHHPAAARQYHYLALGADFHRLLAGALCGHYPDKRSYPVYLRAKQPAISQFPASQPMVSHLRHRPGAAQPSNPPPREWYPYLILREAYIEATSNRDIMLKLYISEGTFNRTRRAAVRALARAIGEMESLLN